MVTWTNLLWACCFCVAVVQIKSGIVTSMAPDETVDKTLLGTKTAYNWATPSKSLLENADMSVRYQGRTCTAMHVNMLLRHGSRNPGADDMEDIRDLAEKIRKHRGSTGPLDFIDTWSLALAPEDGDMLNALGKQEMMDIGSRMGRRFKQLLVNKKDQLEYISSSRERTKESGQFFSRGLSQYLYNRAETATPTANNNLMRIYDSCEYFEKMVDDNDDILEELNMFKEGPRFKRMREDVAKRLNSASDLSFTDDDMEYIWEICAFELMAGVNDTWCLFMTNVERQVMNDAEDLENYYEDSYGNDVSAEIHCVVLRKLFALMDDAMSRHKAGQDYTVGSFMFGHSSTLMGTLTALGLFRDLTPLRASNIAGDHRFKSSLISPMAGNVGFALYACPGNANSTDDVRYAVKLFHNERPLNLGQIDSEMVWYDLLRAAFANTLKCDINALCKYPRDTSAGSVAMVNVLGLIAAIFCYFVSSLF